MDQIVVMKTFDETHSFENVYNEIECMKELEHPEETLSYVDLNDDIKPFGEHAYLVVMSDVSQSIEECDVEVEACISIESVNLFQNVVQDYTFSLQQNNILLYTYVEENSSMGIMESLVSTNAAVEAGFEVQKFAKHVVGDSSMCIIH